MSAAQGHHPTLVRRPRRAAIRCQWSRCWGGCYAISPSNSSARTPVLTELTHVLERIERILTLPEPTRTKTAR
jgi:hypothetical protein